MNLEEKKIKKFSIKDFRAKEWWYTGCYDEKQGIYFSFFFCRISTVDNFCVTLFDPKLEKPIIYSKNLLLDSKQQRNILDLKYHSKKETISYSGDEKSGWRFVFDNKDFSVDLQFENTTPCFTKYDNNFINNYTLMHYIHNKVNGKLKVNNNEYTIVDGLSYYDHCFGMVPRKTGWHWIAVQNSRVALVSLINYGLCAQKYTQIYFKEGAHKDRWIRLNQEVSFEYDTDEKTASDWRVTSCDMDVTVTPIMHTKAVTKIPPLVPFIVDLTHYEFFVKLSGKVRIDNEWVSISDLYGVMEEHYGKW